MSRRNQQEARKSERTHAWSEDDTYKHVFAEVVAFYDARGELHPSDEGETASEITEGIHQLVRTGLTANQRKMAILGAVYAFLA